MAIACDGYPEAQVSKENFTNVKRAFGRALWGGVHPPGSKPTGPKGLPLWYATTGRPRTGRVAMYHLWRYGRVLGSKWRAWRFSLSLREWWLGFRALRRRRDAIFSDSVDWTRDNISQWRVYKRKVKSTGSALCSTSIHLPSLHWGDEVASVQRRGEGEILLSRR